MKDSFEIGNDIATELAEELSRELAEDIARKIALHIVPEVALVAQEERYRKVQELMRSDRVRTFRNSIEEKAESDKQRFIASRLSKPELLARIEKSSPSATRRDEIRDWVETRLAERLDERVEEIVNERVYELVRELMFMRGPEHA